MRLNKLLIFLAFFMLVFFYRIASARADTMINDSYKVEGGNLNSFSGSSSNSEGKKIRFTSGETGPNVYSGTGYRVRAGFEYIVGSESFSFAISSTKINFGDLVPGEPITRTNILTVNTGSASGFQILASEDNEPKVDVATGTSPSIPDTTCDNGNCSESTAGAWTLPLTYGFGYRCDNLTGSSCDKGFIDKKNYKHFSNVSKNQSSYNVMQDLKQFSRAKSQITYKINVSQGQISGKYQNNILYIAIPTL